MTRTRICCLTLALSLAASALGQEGSPIPAETAFETKARANKALRAKLFQGEERTRPDNKEHLEAIDVAAGAYAYPLHWQANDRTPGKASKAVSDFESQLRQLNRSKRKEEVAALQYLFCKAIADRARDVIVAGKPIASVNAARMLYLLPARRTERGVLQNVKDWSAEVGPRLAEGAGDHLGRTMAGLAASDKVNQGAKYYLFRGLGDLMSLPPQKEPLLKKETEEKAIGAALDFLNARTGFTRATPRDELEGYKVLREQALRVLAAGGRHVLGKEKPALHLARIAGGDVYLDPRLDERIEACIGLGRMVATADKSPDFQPSYAAHQVAFAVWAFALEGNLNIEAKVAGRLRPWKVDAGRLLEALDAMSASKDPHVAKVIAQCRPVLNDLVAGRVATGAAELGDWAIVKENLPPALSVFKGDAESVVRYAAEEK